MIYITGDTHGDFRRIFDFYMRFKTSVNDIMIILGDVGINFSGGFKDEEAKWHGGIVYMEKEYPNILLAKDGEFVPVGVRTEHGGQVYGEVADGIEDRLEYKKFMVKPEKEKRYGRNYKSIQRI